MNSPATQRETDKIGVLLTNLGTPDSPSTADVRKYLKEFLSDRRVVSAPRLLWWPILNLVILNTRPKKSAEAYQKIWTDEGSPLLIISQQQAEALQKVLNKEHREFRLELAMRYGKPSIKAGIESLISQGVNRIVVLPLYPQFSHTTTSSTLDAVNQCLSKITNPPPIDFIERYHNHPAYIGALAESVREHWQQNGRAEKLVMSFHGIPQEYADAGDPYPLECAQTADLLAKALELKEDEWLLTFQSRLGPKQWLQPYTNETLASLAQAGVKNIQILCPGFSVDCLETLEEIQIENREVFMSAGGEHYQYIPCLNNRTSHIKMMAELVLHHAL